VHADELEPHAVISGVDLVLRPTSERDLEILTGWFARPDVNRYWGGTPLPRDEIAAKYIGRRRPSVECFIIELANTPVGWIQYHLDAERRGGIDMVLLEEQRGQGVGRAAAHAIVDYLLDELRWSEVTVDPAEWNEDGKRFWAAIGFAPVRSIDDDPDREPYSLMRWARDGSPQRIAL
jgi:aminoglycoside 6'-N-acetyltransferase